MKTSEEIRKIADDIEQVFREHDLAIPDPAAIGQLKFLAHLIAPLCNYCAQKAGKIASLAPTFYSVRKHQMHRNGSDGVRAEMPDNLDRIRSWAEVWKEQGD